MIESLKPKGVYTIEYQDILTGKTIKVEKHNVIVQGFVSALWDFLDYTAQTPSANVLDLTYFAIGEGSTAALRTDTELETEYFRKAITQKSFTDSQFKAITVIGPTEGNPTGDDILEVGMFAGGSITLDSGLLVSRATVTIPKNTNIQLNVTWTLTI